MGSVATNLLTKASALGARREGQVVLLSTTRQRKSKGRALSNGFSINLEVVRDVVFDLDARRIVEHVTDGMAEFFGDRLRRGLRPDHGALPESSAETQQISKRNRKELGVRSGWMADNWWKGKLTGTFLHAARMLKPNGSSAPTETPGKEMGPGGRAFVIQNLLRRRGKPVDFQSIEGAAGVELRRLFLEALGEGMPSSFLGRASGQRRFARKRGRR